MLQNPLQAEINRHGFIFWCIVEFFLLAPVIIIEQTACATSIGSLTEIKQHGDNGMDYFGITARGGGVVSFSGMDKEYKSQRNNNKWRSPVSEQKNDCLI